MKDLWATIKPACQILIRGWLIILGLYTTFGFIVAVLISFFPNWFLATASRYELLLARILAISFFVSITIAVVFAVIFGIVLRQLGKRKEERLRTEEQKMSTPTPKCRLNFNHIGRGIPIGYIVYVIMGIAILSMAVIFHKLVVSQRLTISDAIQGFLAGALVLVTAFYAWQAMRMGRSSEQSILAIKEQAQASTEMAGETKEMTEETRKQRWDSCRPTLVPIKGRSGLAVANPLVVYVSPEELIRLRNIGVGPALNVNIRLEERHRDCKPTIILDEKESSVEPIQAGGEALVQLNSESRRIEKISDGIWIVIEYEDTFGRYFTTEAKYCQNSDSWSDSKVSVTTGSFFGIHFID